MAAKVATPIAWDEYFPLLNKVILALLVLGGMLMASGVDVVQLGGRLWGRSGDVEPALASDVGELVADSRSASSQPGGLWRRAILAVAGMLGVVVLVLYVLSVGGRDAERMKEQSTAKANERRPKKHDENGQQSAPEETECNLASYKLFYPSADTAAAELEQAKA